MATESLTKPRVYWLTEAFFPPLVGGQEKIASHLARGLAARNLIVEVITRQTVPPSAPREVLEGGVVVRRINPPGVLKGRGLGAVVPLLGFLLRLFWILLANARRYDIVIVSGAKIMPLVVLPLCILLRKKFILRVESYFELREPISTESLRTLGARRGKLLFGLLENLRNRALRGAHAVISISAQIRAELLARGVAPTRIVSIPNGVSLREFRPAPPAQRRQLRARLALPDNRLVVLYAGRLSRAKGVPLLIEAWPTLLADHPELYLVVVGSGNRSFDDCEALVKSRVKELGLEREVVFFPETDAVVDYLQSADVWVFPTEYEGFSLALAEAMGCALTVLATSVGAAPQLIQHGRSGFLFPPLDTQALVHVFEEALQLRDQWPAIGSAARDAVAEYDLDLIATRYAELCRSLLDARGVAVTV